MKRFFSYIASARGLAAIVIIAAACFGSWKFSVHHTADGVFQTLYMHLIPAPLVFDNHPPEHEALEPIFEVALPGFLSIFDHAVIG